VHFLLRHNKSRLKTVDLKGTSKSCERLEVTNRRWWGVPNSRVRLPKWPILCWVGL